jgi:anti-sigma B factor antagonist
MDLELDTSEQGGKTILTVRGEIDVYTAPRLRQAIVDIVEAGGHDIVVDMERVDFLDSTGLGVLVEALKRVRSHDGDLAIVATQDKILKIFDITGLNKAFGIHASVAEATQAGPPAG